MPLIVDQTIGEEAQGGGGVSANIAIYDPDIAATAGNRYKTWTEVMAAVATWGTVGGELVVRKSGIFQVATVPAGNYDLSSCYIRSDASSIVPTLSFDAGTTISGFPRIIEGVAVRNNNTAAPLHTVSGSGISILRNASLVNGASTTQPLLSVPSGSNFTLTFDTIVSPLYKQGSSEPVFIEGSLSVDILRLSDNSFFSQSDLFTNNLTGNGNLTITSYVMLPSGYTPSHANYDGNLNVVQKPEIRVQELITAALATELPDEQVWRKRSGVFIASLASNYLPLGNLPGFSPTVDYIPPNSSWDYELIVFAYYRGTPDAVPIYVSKTLKYTMIHDGTTANIVATVTETGSNGTLNINVTAGGNGAAPQHPHVIVQNNDTHGIAVEWKFTRMKNSIATSNSEPL